MKVSTYKTVDLELEVDVSLDDVLSTLSEMVREGEDFPRRLLSAMDWLTRILDGVTDEWIARIPTQACETIAQRLTAQAARYAAVTAESR